MSADILRKVCKCQYLLKVINHHFYEILKKKFEVTFCFLSFSKNVVKKI